MSCSNRLAIRTAAFFFVLALGCSSDPPPPPVTSPETEACVGVLEGACRFTSDCLDSLPSTVRSTINSGIRDAIETCADDLETRRAQLEEGCADVVDLGGRGAAGSYIVETPSSALDRCVDNIECTPESLTAVTDEILNAWDHPTDPEPLLQILLADCVPGGGVDAGPADAGVDSGPRDAMADTGTCSALPGDGGALADGATGPTCAVDPESRWDVEVVGATCSGTKADGSDWDAFSGLPDPKVRLDYGSMEMPMTASTDATRDRLEASWRGAIITGVRAADLQSFFRVHMDDDDPTFDDVVGECTFMLTDDRFGRGQFTLDCPRDPSMDQAGFTVTLRIY